MFCTNCGNKLPDGARFCSFCGARIEEPSEQNIRTVAELEFGRSENTAKVPFEPESVPEEPAIKTPRESMPFDWSAVVDEPHRREIKEIKSPWETSSAIDENELYAEMTPSTDRSRTMSFIDVLKAEKEEKEKSAAEKAIEYTEVLKAGPDMKSFDEPLQLHYAPLFEDLDEPVKTPFDKPEDTAPSFEDEPRFETTKDTIADFDDAVKGFEIEAGIEKDEPVFNEAGADNFSGGMPEFELPGFLKKTDFFTDDKKGEEPEPETETEETASKSKEAGFGKDKDEFRGWEPTYEEPAYEPVTKDDPDYFTARFEEPVYETPVIETPAIDDLGTDEPLFEEPKYDESDLAEAPDFFDAPDNTDDKDDLESIYLGLDLNADEEADSYPKEESVRTASAGFAEKPEKMEMIDEDALFAEMGESGAKKSGMTIAAPADKESEIEELKKRLSELMGNDANEAVSSEPDYEAMTLEEAEKPDFSFRTIETKKVADLYEGPTYMEGNGSDLDRTDGFTFEPINTPEVDDLFEETKSPYITDQRAAHEPVTPAYTAPEPSMPAYTAAEPVAATHAAPAAPVEAAPAAENYYSAPADAYAYNAPSAEPAYTAPAPEPAPVSRGSAYTAPEPATASHAAPAAAVEAAPAAEDYYSAPADAYAYTAPAPEPAYTAPAPEPAPVSRGLAYTAPSAEPAPVRRGLAHTEPEPAVPAYAAAEPAAASHAAPAAPVEAAPAAGDYYSAPADAYAYNAPSAEPAYTAPAPEPASVSRGLAYTAPSAEPAPVSRGLAYTEPEPAMPDYTAPEPAMPAYTEPEPAKPAYAAPEPAVPAYVAPEPAMPAYTAAAVEQTASPVQTPEAKHAVPAAEPVASPEAGTPAVPTHNDASVEAAPAPDPVIELTPAAAEHAAKAAEAEKNSDALSLEELEKNLFGEVPDEETEVEETKKIDKFYTLYRKNEEFQRLLDEEYDKLRGEDKESAKADEAVVEKKTIYRPVEDETIYMPKELVEEEAKLEAEKAKAVLPGEIKIEAPAAGAAVSGEIPASAASSAPVNQSSGFAVSTEADESKPLVELQTGEVAYKKNDRKAAKAAAKAEKARQKEEKKRARKGAAAEAAASAAESEYEDVDTGSKFLTVLAVIIAIILVILLAVILILQVAPDSGAAAWIDGLIENITGGFGLINPDDGQFLL